MTKRQSSNSNQHVASSLNNIQKPLRPLAMKEASSTSSKEASAAVNTPATTPSKAPSPVHIRSATGAPPHPPVSPFNYASRDSINFINSLIAGVAGSLENTTTSINSNTNAIEDDRRLSLDHIADAVVNMAGTFDGDDDDLSDGLGTDVVTTPQHEGTSKSKTPRRRRSNHNEIERARRSQQRARIEELRYVIPSLNIPGVTEGKPIAAVQVVVKARDYIGELERRVAELELFVNQRFGYGNVSASTGVIPTIPETQINSAAASSTGNVFDVTALGDWLSMQQSFGMGQTLNIASPAVSPSASPAKRKRSKLDQFIRFSVSSSSGDDNNASITPSASRKSSLIYADSTTGQLLLGPRSSISQLFSGILPSLVIPDSPSDQTLMQEKVRCGKCTGSINGQIMIDCDRCGTWYHIRCVGIDAKAIPTHWSCGECRVLIKNQ